MADPRGQPAALRHLDGLNPEQRAATEHFEGPILVLAGAGSGKTRVLTARICHLVRQHGVAPDRILAVTFTNKAAGEMRERIRALLDAEPAGMWVGTFHATGARILRRHADRLGWDRTFTIFDADQSLRLVKRVQEEVGLDPKRWSPKAIRAEMSNAKNQLVSAEDFARANEGSFDLFVRSVAKVFPAYQKALKEQNAFDFDDLLMKPVELFETSPELLERYRDRFSFLLVDEYQDTNRAQFRFLELLAADHGNLMVVGDDDQYIYGWRGADIRNILDFEGTFAPARVVRLELGRSDTTARPSPFWRHSTRGMKRAGWCRICRRASGTTRRWDTGRLPSSTGPTLRHAPWKTPFAGKAFLTRSWAACASTRDARSRTCCRTCA
jgi:DNA helicase-2/ATP-dependent DNA helicase PcrA